MPTVPQYNREVSPQLTPTPYNNVNLNEDMFGANIARAAGNLGKAVGDAEKAMLEIKDRIDNTNIVEVVNKGQEWKQKNLLDKENGYYNKHGKDAYGQSEALIKDYDDYMTEQINNAHFTGDAKRRVQYAYQRMREDIVHGVTSHDYNQGVVWSNAEAEIGKTNYINNAVSMINNPEEIPKCIQSGYQLIEWQGEIQNLDETAINLEKMKYRSAVHESVLNAYLSEGSAMTAKDYFENHKTEITPDARLRFSQKIHNEEINYTARAIAANLVGKTPEEAYKYIDGIQDMDVRDAVEREYNRLLRHEDEIQRQKDIQVSNEIMQRVYAAYDNGGDISSIMRDVNISDMSLEQKEKIYKNLKAMQELEGAGNNWADYNILLDKAAFNNEEFVNTNPANYNLTKEQYNKIVEMQRKAANNEYTPEVEMQKAIKGMFNSSFNIQGRDGLHSKEYEEEVVRFLSKVERMQGKAFDFKNTEQLQAILKGFDYKDENAVNKNIDETKELFARAKKHGEVYDLMAREYMMFKGANKREPSPDEIFEMAKRSYNTIENAWRERDMGKLSSAEAIYKSVDEIKAKKGETKVLTYYADVKIPQISRELGIPLQVTSRYRAGDSGGHGKGRKCDVGMAALNRNQREIVFERLLSEPAVASIGTSDRNLLRKYNNPPNPKIRDLNSYDADYKKAHPNTTMNHVNHIDISFDTRYGGDVQGI